MQADNGLMVFESAAFGKVRTVVKDNEPWFVASDICEMFGETNRNRAMQGLDDDEKGYTQIETPGGVQSAAIVNEAGLYAMLFAMQPTKARGVSDTYIKARGNQIRSFKRWITHEVLPDIRRHGMYSTPATVEKLLADPDSMIAILQGYKAEREQRTALEVRVARDAPKVLFADCVEASQQSILIGELAKLLRQGGVNIGQNRLFELLRRDGYLCTSTGDRWNQPTQRAMEMRLFEIRERTINNPDGSVRLTKTTKVTGKGQVYFISKYRNQAPGGCGEAKSQ